MALEWFVLNKNESVNVCTKKHLPHNFIEHSIRSTLSFLRESIFAEDYAWQNGLLQTIDARIKVISCFLFLAAALFIKSILPLLCLYLLCLLLTQLSKIHLGFFLKRSWIFIPLFSFFIALPALFSVITPGETLFSFKFWVIKLTITQPGLYSAITFITRVITCVSFVILLSLTTRHTELLKVLRIFKVPQIFVMTLGMCYRYIYLFVQILENTYLAMKSRVGFRLHPQKGQKIVSLKIAHLWQRSYHLSEDVYRAMCSRAYMGEPKILDEFKTKLKDWVWLFFTSVIFVGLVYLDGLMKI